MESQNNINYYKERLEFTRDLFREGEHRLVDGDMDKIRELVRGYNQFKSHPHYNPFLSGSVETLILNAKNS